MAMEKHLFNLKFAAKQLERDSKKCDKEEKVEKNKLKKAIEKGNMEVARIHAENGEQSLFWTILTLPRNSPEIVMSLQLPLRLPWSKHSLWSYGFLAPMAKGWAKAIAKFSSIKILFRWSKMKV